MEPRILLFNTECGVKSDVAVFLWGQTDPGCVHKASKYDFHVGKGCCGWFKGETVQTKVWIHLTVSLQKLTAQI